MAKVAHSETGCLGRRVVADTGVLSTKQLILAMLVVGATRAMGGIALPPHCRNTYGYVLPRTYVLQYSVAPIAFQVSTVPVHTYHTVPYLCTRTVKKRVQRPKRLLSSAATRIAPWDERSHDCVDSTLRTKSFSCNLTLDSLIPAGSPPSVLPTSVSYGGEIISSKPSCLTLRSN